MEVDRKLADEMLLDCGKQSGQRLSWLEGPVARNNRRPSCEL